jgi:uracil-DNA glycosylase family protein
MPRHRTRCGSQLYRILLRPLREPVWFQRNPRSRLGVPLRAFVKSRRLNGHRDAPHSLDSIVIPNSVLESNSLSAIRRAAADCKNCPLWKSGTQTVFGEGKSSSAFVIVGEQPGDQEDLSGRPFVGPAGKLLDRALEDAGIARNDTYVTNAVKHFKWEPRGKRRIHKKPSPREIAACRPWLEAELRIIQPKTVVCLGATATLAILGPKVRVLRDRGRVFSSAMAKRVFVTIHPSLLLRLTDRDDAKREYDLFVRDLRAAADDENASLATRITKPHPLL